MRLVRSTPLSKPTALHIGLMLCFGIAVVGSVAFSAVAGEGEPGARLAKIDTNRDGVIDRREAAAHPKLAQNFDLLDKNRDGRIDASERPQHHGKGGERMAKLDTNNDGAIDRREAASNPKFAQNFDQFDKNRDGRIDASERPQHHGKGGERMAKLDTNNDGAIDRREAASNPKFAQNFDRFDKNRDGRIDASERPQHHGKGGERMAKLDANGDGRFSRQEVSSNERLSQAFTAIDNNNDGFVTREEMHAFREKYPESRAPTQR
jgi:Ca2+-binding EF-hand superfamily protein